MKTNAILNNILLTLRFTIFEIDLILYHFKTKQIFILIAHLSYK
jgi:hypothetical protein